MIFSNIIIGPEYAPPNPPQPPSPAQPWLRQCDQQLLERLREAELCKTWSLLNVVADEQAPRDRTAGRLLRLELLGRLKRLRRLGLVFSVGRNRVSATKPDPTMRRPTVRRRRLTVAESTSFCAVSATTTSASVEAKREANHVQYKIDAGSPAPTAAGNEVAKTESALIPDTLSEAARQLARLPRNQSRTMTGWLHGQHCWRGRLLELPNGEVAALHWCSRGRVLLAGYRDDPLADEDTEFLNHLRWAARREKDVQLLKCPEAVLLGSRKRGVRERRSELKIASARANGHAPVRAGRRPRGRPRGSGVPVQG